MTREKNFVIAMSSFIIRESLFPSGKNAKLKQAGSAREDNPVRLERY